MVTYVTINILIKRYSKLIELKHSFYSSGGFLLLLEWSNNSSAVRHLCEQSDHHLYQEDFQDIFALKLSNKTIMPNYGSITITNKIYLAAISCITKTHLKSKNSQLGKVYEALSKHATRSENQLSSRKSSNSCLVPFIPKVHI